ncbi:hypothetical protein Leryth_007467 [Lithospermum erythrorhizon]|nr:hypothetical protein Leryth_007467 [Lithospermum erythrorhizon]
MEDDGDSSHVTIKIQREGVRDVCLRIKRNIALKRVMMAYCERVNLEYEGARFTYNGERIKAEQTAKELDMEDDDVVDVWSDQSGGGDGGGDDKCNVFYL